MGSRAKTPDRITMRRRAREHAREQAEIRNAATPHEKTREHREGTSLPNGGRSEFCQSCGTRLRGQ